MYISNKYIVHKDNSFFKYILIDFSVWQYIYFSKSKNKLNK